MDHVEKNGPWKTRVHLLRKRARNAIEPFVERKIEEMKERKLVEWDPEEAKSRSRRCRQSDIRRLSETDHKYMIR